MVIPRGETPDCNGLPITDYRHKWQEIDFVRRNGYDPKMKRLRCKKCGAYQYKAPKPKSMKIKREKK